MSIDFDFDARCFYRNAAKLVFVGSSRHTKCVHTNFYISYVARCMAPGPGRCEERRGKAFVCQVFQLCATFKALHVERNTT